MVDEHPESEDDEEGGYRYPTRQLLLEAARFDDPDIQVGDYVEEQIESVDFGRIGAQTAKQVIVQKVREAERAQVFDEYQGRVGELVTIFIHCMRISLREVLKFVELLLIDRVHFFSSKTEFIFINCFL